MRKTTHPRELWKDKNSKATTNASKWPLIQINYSTKRLLMTLVGLISLFELLSHHFNGFFNRSF